ncbi:MAG: hypothetical protein AAGA15_01320 [Pseudomonadota bacterium]
MHTTSSLLVAVPFAIGISLPGFIGLATTDAPWPDTSLLSGHYQRLYEDAFKGNMPLRDGARAAYTALTMAVFHEAGPDVVIGDQNWIFTAEEFREPVEAVPFAETLSEVRDALAAHDITLIPIIVPDKARVYADHLPRPRSAAIEARYDTSLGALSEMGFAAIDLRTVLVEARTTGATYMRTDTHWSPLGAQIAAEAVAAEAGLTSSGSTSFETTFAAETAFQGDLRPFVDTGPFARWVGVDPETIVQPVTTSSASGLGLFDDPEIGIVLVGTSFSARTEFNFAGFLQEATGQSLVSLAVEGRGPFAPMQDALQSGAITDLSPTVVIWEIPERYIHTRTLP